MPGDYSRKLFDRLKHRSAVLQQQGRVNLDADWNEEIDIQQYRISTEAIDTIGQSGVPKKNDGFKITPFVDGTDLNISPGRIYVDGLLFELDQNGVTYLHQPHYLSPDLSYFSLPASPASPASPPTGANLKDGTYLVYLVGWQKEINFLDDPQMLEVALIESDTTLRLQNVWRVRLLQVAANAAATCKSDFIEWNNLVAPPTGKLRAWTEKNDTQKKPCALPPSAGYRSLENQLYRIQVLNGGDRTTATFVWSRDNASIETAITKVSGSVLTVTDLGKDDVLGFAGNQWVEIVETEPTLNTNSLVQIDFINPDTKEITLKSSAAIYETKTGLKLRRWDISGNGLDNGIPMQSGPMDVEEGIKIQFSDGTYKAGDHWLAPARTVTSDIEWPVDTAKNPVALPPGGIQRHFGRLALLQVSAGVVSYTDCRPLFPSLTEICAEDICFNNTNCSLPQARTVQQAIDLLCKKGSGTTCTLVAIPAPGWESIFANLPDGADAQICFQVGVYPLNRTVTIKNKGNLKFVGCGPASRILASNAEAALIIDSCKTITMRDIYAECGAADLKDAAASENLKGVFTIRNCAAVNMDHLSVRSGTSATRKCTCITINNDVAKPCPVRIEDCDLEIADRQQGILVVNTTECWIERNNLKIIPLSSRPVIDRRLRAGLVNLFMANTHAGAIGISSASNNVTLNSGAFTINFKTDPSLKNEWRKVLAANPPRALASTLDFQNYTKKLAGKLATNETFRNKFPQIAILVKGLLAQTRAIGSQGITIGGQVGKNIIIKNNVVTDVLQGIHVGVSHRTAVRQPDLLQNLVIESNTLSILITRTVAKQDRYGIFVGNCSNMVIENNSLQLERANNADNIAIDGIRVWGNLGPRLMITKNLLSSIDSNQKKSFNIGIHVNPLSAKPPNARWVVMWNVAPSKFATVRVANGAESVPGTNTP